MSHVEGKVAVVTGAGGGFGLLITRMLAERGATAIGFDIQDTEGCRVVDVTDRRAMRAAVDQVVEDHGRIDIMVNNADLVLTRFGGLDAEQSDPNNVRYWAITPEELAAHVVHAIDAPVGLGISDITIRATGEDYVF